MVDLSTAMATGHLSTYKGRDVLRTSIAIRNAGDGLSQAMAVDPVELTIGDTVYVVLECEVAHHDYGPIKDTDCLELKQVLKASGATLVDGDLVKAQLDAQATAIKLAKEQAAGVTRIPFPPGAGEDPDEADATQAMIVQHNTGTHADGAREGCPLCEDEAGDRAAAAVEEPTDGDGEVTPIKGRRSRKAVPPKGE